MSKSTPDRTRLLLGFNLPAGQSLDISRALRAKLARLGLIVDGTDSAESLGRVHHTWRHLWVRDAKRRAISASRIAKLSAAFGPTLHWVAPVVREASGAVATLGTVLPDVLLIAPRPEVDRDRVANALSAYGLHEHSEKSRYLGRWRYFDVENPTWKTAAQIASLLRREQAAIVGEVTLEFLAHASPLLLDPNDWLYERQWAPPRIGAPQAWDLATGRGVVVAIIDSGCDLAHPELRYAEHGLNLDTMSGDGSPVGLDPAHGTQCAGIIGAGLNDDVGVAGLAGECRLLPLASTTFTNSVVAMGILYARDHGARVVNMSFRLPDFMFESSPARDAIDLVVSEGIVLCASAGNRAGPPLVLPARYHAVTACGASDMSDQRLVPPTLPLAASSYGDEIFLGQPVGVTVVAPGIDILTTDISGPGGLTPGPSPTGDYQYFNLTSAAAPHVSAAAALLLSRYPTLDTEAVRRIIARTAEKVGGYVYADVAGYPAGTRHPEMGHGRLNLFRALDLGDVMIADWPGDDGVEPSTPPDGDFWSTSDIIIRPDDDGVFDPIDPTAGVLVPGPGRDHTVYVRVRNVGPADARNVHVEARMMPWVGLEFVYPDDWLDDDARHLRPTPIESDFPLIAAGNSAIARFTLSASQVGEAAIWRRHGWHPCLVGVVTAENDYAFQTTATGANLQMRRNNLAQRNLTVSSLEIVRTLSFPVAVGHPASRERKANLVVTAGRALDGGKVQLVLDDDGAAFPALRRTQGIAPGHLELGKIAGGTLSQVGRHRAITLNQPRAIVQITFPTAGRYPVHLAIRLPRVAQPKERFRFSVAQHSPRRGIVGGATVVYLPEQAA